MSNADSPVAVSPPSQATAKPSGSKLVKITLWTVGILAGACGVLAVVGMLLPSRFTVERSVVVDSGPIEVHLQVAYLKQWPKWNTEHADREYKISGSGVGEGAVQTWTDPDQPESKMTITFDNPTEGIQYTVHQDGEETLKGEIRYAPDGDKTRVTWKVRGEIGNSPIDRWRGLLIERKLAPEFETGLENLKTVANELAAERRKAAAAKTVATMPKTPVGGGGPPGGGKKRGGKRGFGKKFGGGGGVKKRPPADSGTDAKPKPGVKKAE